MTSISGRLCRRPNFEIVRIVRWGDFDRARPKLAVPRQNRRRLEFPGSSAEEEHFADQMLIAGVARMNGHRGIAEHRFRAASSQPQQIRSSPRSVANMPEMALRSSWTVSSR